MSVTAFISDVLKVKPAFDTVKKVRNACNKLKGAPDELDEAVQDMKSLEITYETLCNTLYDKKSFLVQMPM